MIDYRNYQVYRKFVKFAACDADLAFHDTVYAMRGTGVASTVKRVEMALRIIERLDAEDRAKRADRWLTPAEFFGRG